MGGLSLQCLVANGTRLLGMSYTTPFDEYDNPEKYNLVVLIQSNPNPKTIADIKWSLVSVWPRNLSYPQDYSPLLCNVDQQTGVFSMMSAFSLSDPSADEPGNNVQPRRKPGGFQYDPRKNTWSDFVVAPNYRWNDPSSGFAIFQWPGTTTLAQANIASSTKVNIGILNSSSEGEGEFVNTVSWSLDPDIYGYPSRLFFGSNNILYQFGSHVANNRTGALRYILTRIPLFGDPKTYDPPANLPVYNASSLSECASGYINAHYYSGVLYVFCQGIDTDFGPGLGLMMVFRDSTEPGKILDSGLSNPIYTGVERLAGAIIHPFGETSADGRSGPFAFVGEYPTTYPIESVVLTGPDIGVMHEADWHINMTDPYGYNLAEPANRTPAAIIGGSIAGLLVLIALLLFRPVKRRWPQWRRKIMAKIIEKLSKDDDMMNGKGGNKDAPINKIEVSTTPSIDLDGRDKILVTDDMNMDAIDAGTGYMQEVGLGHHPRPAVVTSLAADRSEETDDNGSSITSSTRAMVMAPLQRSSALANAASQLTTPSAPPVSLASPPAKSAGLLIRQQPAISQDALAPYSYTPTANITSCTDKKADAQSHMPYLSPASAANSEIEVAPPYSHQRPDLSRLDTPPFPTPPTPSAPLFALEEQRSESVNRPRSPNMAVENARNDSSAVD
ncbi:hypothetical protein BG011_006672 [Mortierella polycephala]|uniref:Uncharacterized protein n=1 Tax=Mortierella polycephala TaxID=41804 RepID=A0A9P6TZ87_9FUNG|nr:hypothetical protein BG011_006672 [Mortierella polycephala]